MDPPLLVEPSARLSAESFHEDAEWANLASAEGIDDEFDDPDCAMAVAAVDAAALELGRVMSRRMLAAKAVLAQKAQLRQEKIQAEFDADRNHLEAQLDEAARERVRLERRLAKAFAVQANLADTLYETRESSAARMQAMAVVTEWQRSLAALKREGWAERASLKHYAHSLLRKLVGRWRSVSRQRRHGRIDGFWEGSMAELRSALQAHYEPKLAQLTADLEAARSDARDAWRAKEDLGQQLKSAFMKQVVQLNLETASIVNNENGEPVPQTVQPPLPTRPEDLLATARRGLRAQQQR